MVKNSAQMLQNSAQLLKNSAQMLKNSAVLYQYLFQSSTSTCTSLVTDQSTIN